MKIKIPDALTADVPQTFWGKILSATPVVMTVVATMLAGLASSEMTRAQYDRSLAAQYQSKAGDQWSYFQAKRLRGSMQRSTLDLLQATTQVRPLDPAALRQALPGADAALTDLALGGLAQEQLAVPAAAAVDPAVKAALEAIEAGRPESEIQPLIKRMKDEPVAKALAAARDRTQALDEATKPLNQAIERIESQLDRQTVGPAAEPSLRRDFTAARLRYSALRYDTEARLNQAIANLYELEVRRGNFSAERHHRRSQRFFYGMLAAQAAVIIATFAIAARKRNLLWSLAAAAGVAAIIFAVYVYLYV